MQRPKELQPGTVLLVEIDSREFHENRFDRDHARQTTYDLLGFEWVTFTPNQLEHQRARSRNALEAVLGRTTRTTQFSKTG
jgi:very-short-patch-repair endonuclease